MNEVRRRRPFGSCPFLGRRDERSDWARQQLRRDIKPALVGQLFERAECFVDWNTFASRGFENQANGANGREPDRRTCSARCSVIRQ
jgi:hypothetical protein